MPQVRISISPYLKEFLVDKFGSEPISFPQNSMFMRHLTEGCAPPPVSRNAVVGELNGEESLCTDTSPKRRKVHLSVCLPETVFRSGRVMNVNDSWKLNYDSCKSFRKTTDTMFWADCDAWITDYERARRANKEYFSRENAIRDFILYHGIDMHHDETIIRQYKRRRKELLAACAIKKPAAISVKMY